MVITTRQPEPPLRDHIDWFWYYEGLTPNHQRERVLPDGTFELVINLKEEPRHVFDRSDLRQARSYRRGWFSGAHSRFIVIDTAPDSSMIGAHFKPGGAARFLRLPACELTDRVVELDRLWGQAGWDLRDALIEAPGPSAKFGVLQRFLQQRLHGAGPAHPPTAYAARQLTRSPQGVSLRQLARSVGLSHKQFIERFRRDVGLTPKRFCRIRRFHQVLQQTGSPGAIDWADLACACGYYDQAHFIHDFQLFSGLRPSTYLAQRIDESNFVPLLE